MFDLENDPEETRNLATVPGMKPIVAEFENALRAICDPELVDRQAKQDQAALIARHGGAEAAFELGRAVAGGTPAPTSQTIETAHSGRTA